MKKIYIKDIVNNTDKLAELFNNNKEIQNICYNWLYEDNMMLQNEDFEQFNLQGIETRQHYNSFFLELKDVEKFIDNFNEFTGNEELQRLYKKAYETYTNYQDVYYNEDNEEKENILFDELEKECKELLKEVEKNLHCYEDIESYDLLEYFIINVQDNFNFENLYYIEEENNNILYEDISYTKSYN